MPLYEYLCQACEHPFEELVRGDERPLCPACGSARLSKRFSTFALAETASAPTPARFAPGPGPGACGTCGDPRGPGACAS